MTKEINKFGIIVSIVLFSIALTQDAFCTSNDCSEGFFAFLMGWLCAAMEIMELLDYIIELLSGNHPAFNKNIGASITWMANPLIFLSILFLKRQAKTALATSVLSVLIIISFLFFNDVLATEAGHYFEITKIKSGYWLWLASANTIVITASISLSSNRSNTFDSSS